MDINDKIIKYFYSRKLMTISFFVSGAITDLLKPLWVWWWMGSILLKQGCCGKPPSVSRSLWEDHKASDGVPSYSVLLCFSCFLGMFWMCVGGVCGWLVVVIFSYSCLLPSPCSQGRAERCTADLRCRFPIRESYQSLGTRIIHSAGSSDKLLNRH